MLRGKTKSGEICLTVHQGWQATVSRTDTAAVPVTHKVPPDYCFQFLHSQALRIEAVVEQLTLHSGPQTLAAGVIVPTAAVAVHALADTASLHRCPISIAGVQRAAIGVEDGPSEIRADRHRAVQRSHTQSGPHVVVHR